MMSAIRRLALRSGIRCATKSHRRVAGPHSQRATKTGRNWPDMSPSVYRRRTSWPVLDSPETGFEDLWTRRAARPSFAHQNSGSVATQGRAFFANLPNSPHRRIEDDLSFSYRGKAAFSESPTIGSGLPADIARAGLKPPALLVK